MRLFHVFAALLVKASFALHIYENVPSTMKQPGKMGLLVKSSVR